MLSSNNKRIRYTSAFSVVEALLIVLGLIFIGVVGFYLGTSQAPPSPPFPPQSPAVVTVSGTFGTTTFGTSASWIRFQSSTSGISYPANMSGNNYEIHIPNHAAYTITIHWTSAVDSGTCNAGKLPLYLEYVSTLSTSWSC